MRLSEFTIEMFVHVIVVTVQADKGQHDSLYFPQVNSGFSTTGE